LKAKVFSGGSASSVAKNFEKLWEKHEKPSFFGELLFKMAESKAIQILKKYVNEKSKVIDVGCGTGRTLSLFRKNGYLNSIGIDVSKKSIEVCTKKGFLPNKDVFLMDINKNRFEDKEFDVVFAEGLLEHFKNFQPVVEELCRISKRYVLLIQPNHFTIFRMLEKIYYLFFPRAVVKELTYKVEDFNKAFEKNGYVLKEFKSSFLNFYWVLLYEKSK
jgi:methionine biosynthesis protein MetW